MGIYGNTLECGCIQQTVTLEIPAKTITIHYCKIHKPSEINKISENNKTHNVDNNTYGKKV
jgi:hypothetical protein